MNIGVIGWWNNGNQGDFAILENITSALATHHIVPIDVPFNITPDEIARLNQLDFLIFGGGGLLTSSPAVPFDTFDVWGDDLHTPIGILGVGVDEVKPQHQRAVQHLLERAMFVFVRDTVSQKLLNHPKVQLMPDVTFWQPHTSTEHNFDLTTPNCGVNLRSLPSADRQQWVAILQSLPVRLHGVPLATYSAFEELETLRTIDPHMAHTFDYDLYQQLDLMIGTAFHSVVFAIQSGVPVIAIAYAPKVERLMFELGLSDFSLKTNEWPKVVELVERIRREHTVIVAQLRESTRQLSERTRQIMHDVQRLIEGTAPVQRGPEPPVSIIVLDSDSPQATDRTLESCLTQTYSNTEIILVSSAPMQLGNPRVTHVCCAADASLAQRLNTGLAKATGQYFTWIKAGDRYTLDAIAVLAQQLQRRPTATAVYADYYTMHEPRLIAAIQPVDEPNRLIRRNIIGPCFLYRRNQTSHFALSTEQCPLPIYDFWLRTHQSGRLIPIHSRLMYCQASNATLNNHTDERRTRQQWRATQPWLKRTAWNIIDTDVVESLIVLPFLKLRRQLIARRP